MRQEFEMSEEDLKVLLDACRPVPYIVVGGLVPRSPQENANDAWCALGRKMGFDGMTVTPLGASEPRRFTADTVDGKEYGMTRGEKLAALPDLARALWTAVDAWVVAPKGNDRLAEDDLITARDLFRAWLDQDERLPPELPTPSEQFTAGGRRMVPGRDMSEKPAERFLTVERFVRILREWVSTRNPEAVEDSDILDLADRLESPDKEV